MNDEGGLNVAIADVYGGPLDGFVARREALAKELRSAGQRDAASTIKRLRKPSRIAWALDLGARSNPHALDALASAVTRTLDAQSAGGDVRTAMTRLREAVRAFAGAAADAASVEGQTVDTAALGNAVLAVLGRSDSFEQLRDGCLAEVPEGGGLDFLAVLPVPATAVSPDAEREAVHPPATATDADARENVRVATAALEQARNRVDAALERLRVAESAREEAEARVREADAVAQAARDAADRARADADAAAGQVGAAERALADAQARAGSTSRARPRGRR